MTRRNLILGGGISGLAAAWFLHKRFPQAKIVLLEGQKRLGGWIETQEINGFSFEMGPRTFQLSRCPELLQLIEEVGLKQDLLFSNPAAQKRYLLYHGKLRTIKSLWPHVIFAVVQDLFAPKGTLQEESIYEFARRRFGKFAAELFLDPLAKGVFGGDIRRLSLDACLPFLRTWEKEHRCITKALFSKNKQSSALFTLRGGMHRLIEKLANLPIEIHTDCPVQSIQEGGVLAGGRTWEADLIISALPGSELARLTRSDFFLSNESMSVVALGYSSDVLAKKGYGYLVPTIENEPLLGQIWDSCIFPSQGQTKVTSMVRAAAPHTAALDAMRRHLRVVSPPDAISIKKTEIPQYEVGHASKIAALHEDLNKRYPNLKLIGNYLKGASVESCIRMAKEMIERHGI